MKSLTSPTSQTLQKLKAKATPSLWTEANFLVHSPTYTFTDVQNGTHTKPINHSMFVIAKVWNNLTLSQQSAS